jgi:hypothetical protein
MAGDATQIKVWDSGDVYIWDPAKPFVAATGTPKDTTAALPADWKPAGLMLGDPGVGMSRSVERTDVNSWQQGRVLERIKNPKADLAFTLLEDNATVMELVAQEDVPSVKKRYILLDFLDDAGNRKLWVSLAEVRLFVSTDNQTQDVKGREITGSLVPVAGKYWKILEGKAPAVAPKAGAPAGGTPAPVSIVKTFTVGSGVTAFTVTVDTQTTPSISVPVTAAALQTALEGLSNVGTGKVKVAGTGTGPFTATFTVAVTTVTAAGTSGTVTVA